MKRCLLLLMICFFSLGGQAASLCVGPTGTGNGTDWSNPLPWATFTPVRGNVYYFKNGAYSGARTFATAVSGTSTITFQKATIADHGPATGWSNAFEAAATWGANITVGDYWIFNGVFGAANLTGVATTFGFLITTGDVNNTACLYIGSNSTARYVEAYGVTNLGNFSTTNSLTCIGVGGTANATVEFCYCHGSDNLINTQTGGSGSITTTGAVIRNNVFQASRSTSFHSNVIFWTAAAGAIYNNLIFNFNDEGIFPTWTEFPPTNTQIYNNVIWGGGGPSATTNPRGVEIRQSNSSGNPHTYSNILVYGNTFVDLGSGGFVNRANENGWGSSTGCAYVNNLEYASASTVADTATVSTNTTLGATTIFISYAGGDFHLTADTATGTSLSSPYNVDKDGVARPSGGVWDRGAYQFNTGAATPAAPTNYRLPRTLTGGGF